MCIDLWFNSTLNSSHIRAADMNDTGQNVMLIDFSKQLVDNEVSEKYPIDGKDVIKKQPI